MKNLVVSLCLLAVLTIFGLFVFKQTTEAQNNVVANLLDLPAPPPADSLNKGGSKNRAENFFSKNNPPPDDAPIEDLLDYWKTQSESYKQLGYNVKMSDASMQRIFAEIEKEPESLASFLNVLPDKPEAADFVKRLYERGLDDEDGEKYQSEQVKQWLTYHSDYFSEDLLKMARQVGDANEYVTNQEALLALAKVDWEKARTIIDRLRADANQPVSQVLANWALYQHAVETNSAGDVERYRDELKAAVENKSASPGMRDLAMDALAHSEDFAGRDDWYLSLLGDETLADLRVNGQSYTGLTTLMLYSPPEKFVHKMIELAGSGNPAIRGAAVRNLTTLLDEKNPDVVRALLPWLENPVWAKQTGNERQLLVNALANFEMPESVPGLIAMLGEKTAKQNLPSPPNANMSNSATSNGGDTAMSSNEIYPYRSAAINALVKQKDARAVSALRLILPQVESYERGNVVKALLASGGFSVAEQIDALETIARNARNAGNKIQLMSNVMIDLGSTSNSGTIGVTEELSALSSNTAVVAGSMTNSKNVVDSAPYQISQQTYNPADIKLILGGQLLVVTEVSDELVAGLIERIEILEKIDARLASVLRNIMRNWRGAAVNSMLLKDLKNGKAEVDSIVKLLSLRKDLREKQSNDVFDIRGGKPVALGIAACLLEDNNEYDALLSGENAEARTAMLACARLIRASLPVQKVAENLRNSDKLLALAAERYLESEDSPEARRIVLSVHPNEAKILGATTYFAPDEKSVTGDKFLIELFASIADSPSGAPYYLFYNDDANLKTTEKRLQKEVRENQELLGVYAFDNNFIRIYKDKAVFSWEENEARYRERDLTNLEIGEFKSYLASRNADELPPFLSVCESCESKELLMLGRGGGRRVYVKGERLPNFFAELERMFENMRKQPARLHYRLEKDVAGLEILFSDVNLQVRAVWKNAGDFRVLIEDAERRKQIDKELTRLDALDEEKSEDENVDYEKIEQTRRRRRILREYENFQWRRVERDAPLGDALAQPPQSPYIPTRDNFAAQTDGSGGQWKARTANLEIRAGEDGLYKISRGQLVKIQSGYYENPLVTPNGRWAIATKYDGGEYGAAFVRVNLKTGKEFKIKVPEQFPKYTALAFIPAIGKTLIAGGYYDGEGEEGGEYVSKNASERYAKSFLLDAETGLVEQVKGEVRPLAQQTFRPLQPTVAAVADEFWAAIPDAAKKETQVGIFNQKTLAFKTLLKIPQIQFDSMDMWADESEHKIYFVYQGHLLGLPIPAGK